MIMTDGVRQVSIISLHVTHVNIDYSQHFLTESHHSKPCMHVISMKPFNMTKDHTWLLQLPMCYS